MVKKTEPDTNPYCTVLLMLKILSNRNKKVSLNNILYHTKVKIYEVYITYDF